MLEQVRIGVTQALEELQEVAKLEPEQLLIVGASSSEVVGKRIGTAGSLEAAEAIVDAVLEVQKKYGFDVAFQCCEHLNRALVISRETAIRDRLETVSVIPVPKAGGSVAACAYRKLQDPVVVESVRAHAGIDIGDTLIGMHLRAVAVPFRASIQKIGEAHLTLARTRPKLIGGNRAVYELEPAAESAGTSCS